MIFILKRDVLAECYKRYLYIRGHLPKNPITAITDLLTNRVRHRRTNAVPMNDINSNRLPFPRDENPLSFPRESDEATPLARNDINNQLPFPRGENPLPFPREIDEALKFIHKSKFNSKSFVSNSFCFYVIRKRQPWVLSTPLGVPFRRPVLEQGFYRIYRIQNLQNLFAIIQTTCYRLIKGQQYLKKHL